MRERLCYPAWKWRKFAPKFVRQRAFKEIPPALSKALLIRNFSQIQFNSVHHAKGASRSKLLCGLLHYKLDIDLQDKVKSALREKQYWKNSIEYNRYSKLLNGRELNLLSRQTRKFEGVESLRNADVMCCPSREQANFHQLKDEIWHYGDVAMQKQVWAERWNTMTV